MANATSAKNRSDAGQQGVAEKAKDIASAAGEKARDLAGQASDAVSAAQDRAKQAAGAVADYFQSRDFSQMADDVGNVVRRYPVASVLVGIAVGYLIGRATAGSSTTSSRNWSI
jgi:ElaB/YqjD/DUF883 family membrane-anchored ribosome-binding protein